MFQVLVGRGLIARDQCRAVQGQLQDDLDNHRLEAVPLDLDRVFTDACQLSSAYTARFLARSLELAVVGRHERLAPDQARGSHMKQLAVAKATGVTVLDIKRRLRRQKTR